MFDDLIEKLIRTDTQGVFKTYREALVFAASVGLRFGRSAEIGKSSKSVEWSTMVNRAGVEQFVELVAFSHTQDVEILGEDRLTDRVRILESYACGGLEVITEVMGRDALTPREAVLRLTRRELEKLKSTRDDTGPVLAEFAEALGFD